MFRYTDCNGITLTRVSKGLTYLIDAMDKSKLSKKRIGGLVTVNARDIFKFMKYALAVNLCFDRCTCGATLAWSPHWVAVFLNSQRWWTSVGPATVRMFL